MATDPEVQSSGDMKQVEGRTSGRVGEVLWWSRQLTGKPHIFRGYIEVDGDKRRCGHDHRTAHAARFCALRTAQENDGTKGAEDG